MNAAIATAVGGIDLSNYYERTETYSQAEVNSVVSGAIDALNITQFRTESQVSTAISDALAPYYTASEVDAAIDSNSFNAADYFTRTQSDSRFFPNNANPGNAEVFTLVRDSVSIPRQIRGILPRAPLAWSYLFSGTITELRCDAYSKAEADGRYLSSTGYTTTLDPTGATWSPTPTPAPAKCSLSFAMPAQCPGSSGASSLGPRSGGATSYQEQLQS